MIDEEYRKRTANILDIGGFLILSFIFSKFQTFFLHHLEGYNLYILALQNVNDAYIPISGPNVTKKGNPKGGIIG